MYSAALKKITHVTWPTHNRKENLIQSVKSFINENDPSQFNLLISNSGDISIKEEIDQLYSAVDIKELASRQNWIESLNKSKRSRNKF